MSSQKLILASLAVILVVFAFATESVSAACLANNEGCQPDGSLGNCCSGFCYKQPGWNIGVCVNSRAKRSVCLSNGLPCKSDGSRGNCCSGFCSQGIGQEWGNCQ